MTTDDGHVVPVVQVLPNNVQNIVLQNPKILAALLLGASLFVFLSPVISVLQLLGILLVLGGILIYTSGDLRLVRGVRKRLHELPAKMDAATAALRAADAAKQAAKAAQKKTRVEYLPSLDMYYAGKSVGAYLSDNMFKLLDPHPGSSLGA